QSDRACDASVLRGCLNAYYRRRSIATTAATSGCGDYVSRDQIHLAAVVLDLQLNPISPRLSECAAPLRVLASRSEAAVADEVIPLHRAVGVAASAHID